MKKILVILSMLAGFAGESQIRISDMPTYIGNPSGGYVPIVIAGANRKIDAVNFTTNLSGIYTKSQTDSIAAQLSLQKVTNAGNTTTNSISVTNSTGGFHQVVLGFDSFSGQLDVTNNTHGKSVQLGNRYVDSGYTIDFPKIHIAPSARATIPYSINSVTADTVGNIPLLGTAPIVISGNIVSMTNQGTTTTVLHGNGVGNPGFGQIVNNDIGGKIDSAHLFIQTINTKYPVVASPTNDTVKISQSFLDSSNLILTTTGTSGAATMNQSTKTLNIPVYSGTTPTFSVYQALGGVVQAEPIGGNLSNITAATALADQTIRFTIVYLPQATTVTGVKWWQNIVGSYTSNNYNGVALYSYSAGNLALIDTSINDGNIWKSAQGLDNKAFLGTHALSAGVYVIAMLYCRSAEVTAPTVGQFTNLLTSGINAADFTNSAKLNSTLGVQTVMPTTKAMSALSNTGGQTYVALY